MPKLFATWAVTTFAILSFARLGEAQSQWNEIIEAAGFGPGCVEIRFFGIHA